MADKLLASVRLDYSKLQTDISKINDLIRKINNGKTNINLNISLTGLNNQILSSINTSLDNLSKHFTNLNRQASEFQGRVGAINTTLNQMPRTTALPITTPQTPGISGNIIKSVGSMKNGETFTTNTYQDESGYKTTETLNAKKKLIASTQELINKETDLQRKINEIINLYRSLSQAEQMEQTNINATIASLDRLLAGHAIESNEYKKIMAIKQQMISINTQANRQREKEATDQLTASLNKIMNSYKSLSIYQQQDISTINGVINSLDRLTVGLNIESNEYKKVIAAKQQMINVTRQVIAEQQREANNQATARLNQITNAYKSLSLAQQKNPAIIRQTILALKQEASQYATNSRMYKQVITEYQRMMNVARQLIAEKQKEKAAMAMMPLQNAINSYKNLSVAQQKMTTNSERVVAEANKVIQTTSRESAEYAKAIKIKSQYARITEQNIRLARQQYQQQVAPVSGMLDRQLTTGVLGSGDARATVLDRVANSFVYTTSALMISKVYMGITNAVKANVEYEQSLIDLARTMDAVTNNQIRAMGEGAIELSKKYGTAVKMTQDAQTELARAGIDNQTDLMQMSESVLLGLNTTEIKDAAEMTGFLVSAIKQLGLEWSDSNKIIDEWNFLADKYAVKSNDFAEAIQKSGSASKNLGISLEDLNSMVVVLGERTQASGNEIGNAVKTLESYILRPKTIKTLESYGIQVMKNNKEFLSFKEIMTNVNNVLAQFDEESKASNDILQSIGGTWRKNWVSILAESWDEVDEITRRQADAMGYSAKENEKVMDTYAKRLEVLSASATEFAIKLGDAGLFSALKSSTGVLDFVLNVFDKLNPTVSRFVLLLGEVYFGLKLVNLGFTKMAGIGLSEKILTMAMNMGILKNITLQTKQATEAVTLALNAKNITTEQAALINAALARSQMNVTLTGKAAAIQQKAFALSIRETAASSATFATTLSRITIGLTVGLTAGLFIFSEIRRRQEEMKTATEDAINTSKQNQNLLIETSKYYKENKDQITDNEQVREELYNKQIEMIAAFGDEAKGLDLVNGKYEEQIKLIEQLNKATLEKTLQEMELRAKAAEDKKYDAGGLKITPNIPIISDLSGRAGIKQNSGIKLNTKEYYKYLKDMRTAILDFQNTNDDTLLKSMYDLEAYGTVTSKDWVEALGMIDNEMKELQPDIDIINNKVKLQNDLIRQNLIDTGGFTREQKIIFEELSKSFDDLDTEDYKKQLEKLSKAISKVKIVSGEADGASKKLKDTLGKVKGFDNLDVGGAINKAIKKAVAVGQEEDEEALANSNQALRDAISNMQTLQKIQDEYNKTGKLTSDNLVTLVEKYPELFNSIKNEKDMREQLKKAIEAEKNAANTSLNEKLLGSKKYTEVFLRNNKTLYSTLSQYYGADFSNYKTLGKMKADLETRVIEFIGKNWNRYYNNMSAALGAQISQLQQSAYLYVSQGRGEDLTRQLEQMRQLKAAYDSFNTSVVDYKFDVPSFTGGSGSGGGSGKSGGSSSKTKATTEATILKDKYLQINQALARTNSLIERQNALYEYEEKHNDNLDKKIAYMEYEIKLMQLKKTYLEQEASLIRKERAALEKELKKEGFKFSSEGDTKYINNTQKKIDAMIDKVNKHRKDKNKTTYNKLKAELEDMQKDVARYSTIQTSELVGVSNEWLDVANSIEEVKEKVAELKIEKAIKMFVDKAESLNKAIINIDFELQITGDEDVKKKSDLIIEKSKLLQQMILNETAELKKLLATRDKEILNSEAYKEKIDALTESIRGNVIMMNDLRNEQEQMNEAAAEDMQTRISSLIDKGLELKKKALEDELNLYKEYVDKIIQERERQYESEDFQKNINKEYEGRQAIINKINRLNLDNSLESYNKRKQLEKELLSYDEKITDMKTQRQRELVRRNLDDNVKNREDLVKETEQAWDKEYDIIKKRAMINEAVLTQSFDKIKSKFPEIFDVINSSTGNFFDTFKEYEEHFGTYLGDVSKKFVDEILPQLKQAVDYMKNLTNTNNGITNSNQTINSELKFVSNPKPQIVTDKENFVALNKQYSTASTIKKVEIMTQLKSLVSKYKWTINDAKSFLPSFNNKTIKLFKQGINAGLATQTGQYYLHGTATKPEWILTNDQMYNFVKNMANTIPIKQTTNNNTNNNIGYKDIVLNINIMGNVDEKSISKIQDAGNGVIKDLKKTLSKNGILK